MPILTTLGAACAKAWGFTSGLVKDQYFNLVSLLLPGNGTNATNNRDFRDSGTANGGTGFSITPNGNVTQGSFSPFSQTGWGNYFNGSSYLTAPNNTALDLSTGDFTIECWFYPTTFSSASPLVYRYNGNYTSPNDFQYAVIVNTSGAVTVRPYQGLTDFSIAAGTAVLNSWNHIALVRTGNTFWGFLNGNRSASSQTITGALNSSTWATTVGVALSSSLGNAYANGYISNVRITKGGALYTTSTYTVPVTPLTTTVSAGTVSLLTCQSNRFFDIGTANSGTGFPITVNGSPSVVAFSPFAPTDVYKTAVNGGSGYFDGTGDYLTSATNIVDFAAGQAFTVECWVYMSSNTPAQAISANGVNAFSLVISGGQVLYGKAGVIDLLVGTMAAANQWVHIAVGRNSSSTSRLWVNGTSVATSGSDTLSFNAATMYIGSNSNPSAYLNGYMAGLRVVKGSDVYGVANTSITVPTAPPTAITNTQLLLNFTNGAIFDATAKNDLETVGNAQISTTQSKWGGSSIYLDGTGDYLAGATKSSVYFNLTGDFTIETWAYFTTVATGFAGIVSWADSSGFNGWELINNAGTVYFRFLTGSAGVGQVTAGSAISANQWYYISVIRSGSTITLYINGSSVGSTTYSGSQTSESSFLKVGADRVGTSLMTGYLQDMRISKYVRPTTVPTAPFPVQ